MTQLAASTIPEALPCCAVVLSCVDYRSVEPSRHLLADQELAGAFDLIAWPSGAAALTTCDRPFVTEAMTMACELHYPDEIILAVHHDCGRLGGSAHFAGHEAEIATLDTALTMAGEAVVSDRLPGLPVHLVRLDHAGTVSFTDDSRPSPRSHAIGPLR